jgi:hypothetical protein
MLKRLLQELSFNVLPLNSFGKGPASSGSNNKGLSRASLLLSTLPDNSLLKAERPRMSSRKTDAIQTEQSQLQALDT